MTHTPEILSDNCTIILGDSLQVLPTLTGIDAVVTDPPYGINFQHGGGGKKNFGEINTKPIHGDDAPFDPGHILQFAGVKLKGASFAGMPVLMFGADHYASRLPDGGAWYTWDKSCGMGPASSFADAEYMWATRRNPRRIYRHLWMGCTRAGEGSSANQKRLHVSQKPVELMMWCIETCRIGIGKTILDPYMGSGSTGVAALRTGRKFVGVEIDEENYIIARERLLKEIASHAS